ncbi:MAG: hypothetical protein JXR10_09120 [Cyclobacteriaceae bacterium]
MSESTEDKEKRDVGYYFNFGEVFGYFFRKKDPNRPSNISLKAMHGVNKFSMLMFLICVIVIVTRWIMRS